MDTVTAVFCRYAIDSIRPSQSASDMERYGLAERLQAALSSLRSIDTCQWINDPWLEARADCKVHQRSVAVRLGLRTPRQIISSDVGRLRNFSSGMQCVVKPISDSSFGIVDGNPYCDRPIPSSEFLAPYTIEFDVESVLNVSHDGTPLLVQERVAKIADLRCIVLDDAVYCFSMPYRSGNPIDFRASKIESIIEYDIPTSVAGKLSKMNRCLGVRYSACDLLLTDDGNVYFLEANVSGNWLFCDIKHGMKVTRAIARSLLSEP